MGIEAVDLVIEEGLQPALVYPFQGNIDLDRVEQLFKTQGERIPFGMITVTNNARGGQPVSMANIRDYSALLKRYGKPFIMDVCHFSENAMFIKMREPGYENTPIKTLSAKKDGMVNIGGFIVQRSDEWMDAVRNVLIMTEGFPTYGGLAGCDLEALAVELEEGMREDCLRCRLRQTHRWPRRRVHRCPHRVARHAGRPLPDLGAVQCAVLGSWHSRCRDRLHDVWQTTGIPAPDVHAIPLWLRRLSHRRTQRKSQQYQRCEDRQAATIFTALYLQMRLGEPLELNSSVGLTGTIDQ